LFLLAGRRSAMAQASSVVPEIDLNPYPARHPESKPGFRFTSLVFSEPPSAVGRKSATLLVSVMLHCLLVTTIVVLPLVFYDTLPAQDVLKAFFVQPLEVLPPPPPPPPPAPGLRAGKTATTPPPVVQTNLVAPVEIPAEIKPEEGLSLGVEGGAAGGVEGGVPGGVVGGIVGGLREAPPPPKVIRVGGLVKAPKLVHNVTPIYPQLAVQARLSGVIIVEAQVDTRGYVRTARVLRGNPILDDAALDAVKQWRYQPLLLNGQPSEFILTVTVVFNLIHAAEP
jgi:protein TonB